DADTGGGIWNISTLGAGEMPSDDRGCSQVTPQIGITSTPVIRRPAGSNGVIYTVAMSKNSSGDYFQRLHALDATTGKELYNGPVTITAKYPGTGDNSSGGNVVFDPAQYKERSGLLLAGETVYLTWASHCDIRPYTGWVMGYNATTLAQKTVINVTPNGNEGAIWGSGAGLTADGSGNIFFLDANGVFDTTLTSGGFPDSGDYGNAFIRLTTSGGLAVADYFEMDNGVQESNGDVDLGSGGALLLPPMKDGSGNTWNLAVGAGKDSKLLTTPVAKTNNSFGYPEATPSISSNKGSNTIVWAAENTNPAVLHAYNAKTLVEIYNTNQAAGGRDHFGAGNKYITPMIINGKVYVGTTNGVGAFGVLSEKAAAGHTAPAGAGADKATASSGETDSASQRRAIP